MSIRIGVLRAATCMLRTANVTASAIWRGSGPVISCASIRSVVRSVPRYRVAVITALGSQRSGLRVHSRIPVTVARVNPASSFASTMILSSAVSGCAAPSLLISGSHSSGSRVSNAVSGTGCSSNKR